MVETLQLLETQSIAEMVENNASSNIYGKFKNIGWSLGNDCPYRCSHCYSLQGRLHGKNLNKATIIKIVNELKDIGVVSVTLGGNEPFFTNGLSIKDSLLPFILERLYENEINSNIITSGITLELLNKHFSGHLGLLHSGTVSIDSPFFEEHNANRGANLWHKAQNALEILSNQNIPSTIIMCAMNWNFSKRHLKGLILMAKEHESFLRINPIKKVEKKHSEIDLSWMEYYEGFEYLINHCYSIELNEPNLRAYLGLPSSGCSCGKSTFRIHSINPDGTIPISPCIYMHDFKMNNLVHDNLSEILRSDTFRHFRSRNDNPEAITACKSCSLLNTCQGGCSARSYYNGVYSSGLKSMLLKDPLCPKNGPIEKFTFDFVEMPKPASFIHSDYMCTWAGKPR